MGVGPLPEEQIERFGEQVRQIRDSLHKVIVGQEEVIDQLLVCALTGSHALLVGVPGLAKTLLVKAFALLEGRTAPILADLRKVALPILRHRIIVNHRAIGDSVRADDVVRRLVDQSEAAVQAAG